jgi:4-hydroxy-tetrahydrodipicolinate synthase
MKHLFGATCATITPMTGDGEVNIDDARKLYRYLGKKGIHCLYPNGTNGESLSLTECERKRLAEACVEANEGVCSVYIQCGAATVRESYALVEYAHDIGADGVGLMTPVFFPTDEESLEQYYEKPLARYGDFPIYIYNIPSRTGNDLMPSVFGKLCRRFDNLCGIKYSAPDLLRIQQYLNAVGEKKTDVLIGCDNLALACLTVGGKGFVSGPGAVFADWQVAMYRSWTQGDMSSAIKYQERMRFFAESMAGIPEIPAIKYMLKRQGIISSDVCREPLRRLRADEKQRLDTLLEKAEQFRRQDF